MILRSSFQYRLFRLGEILFTRQLDWERVCGMVRELAAAATVQEARVNGELYTVKAYRTKEVRLACHIMFCE